MQKRDELKEKLSQCAADYKEAYKDVIDALSDPKPDMRVIKDACSKSDALFSDFSDALSSLAKAETSRENR